MSSNAEIMRFEDALIVASDQFEPIELKPLYGLSEIDVRGLHKKELATKMRLIRPVYKPPNEFIAVIKDGLAHMRSGVVGCAGGVYKASITKMAAPLVEKWPSTLSEVTNAIQFDGPVAVVANYGLTNYWHWHIQCLPSILSYRTHLSADVRFIFPPLRQYQRESLVKLGIDSNHIVEVASEYIKASTLYYCSVLRGAIDDLSPNSVSAFSTLTKSTPGLSQTPKRRIYISRLDTTVRQCENEIELIILLQSLGFESFTLSLLTYDEQIRLFRDAEIVCGMHGAGLTNAGFADASTLVIELANQYYIRTGFYAQSSLLGQSHTIFASPTDEAVGHLNPWTPGGMPWRIDAMRTAKFVAEKIRSFSSQDK